MVEPATEELVQVVSPNGKTGRMPLSKYLQQEATGQYRKLTPDEIERVAYEKSLTDEPLEKLQGAAEEVFDRVTFGLPSAVDQRSAVEREQSKIRRSTDLSQGIGLAADVGTSLLGGGISKVARIGKEAVEDSARALVREGTEQLAERSQRSLLGQAAKAAEYLPSTLVTRGTTKFGSAVERGLERLGAGKIASATGGLAVEGASEAALFQVRDNISEASLGNQELTAEKLLAGVGETALLGGAFGGTLGAVSGGLSKGLDASTALTKRVSDKITHVLPDMSKLKAGGTLDSAIDTYASMASKVSGTDAGTIKRLFKDPSLRQDHLNREVLQSEFNAKIAKGVDDMRSVETVERSLAAGERKAGNVAKFVKRGPETLRAADEASASVLRPLLSDSPFLTRQAEAAFGKKEAKALKGLAASAQKRVAAALKKGDEAEAYIAIENLKRDFDMKAKRSRSILARGGSRYTEDIAQIQQLSEFAELQADILRKHLEDTNVWGAAGKNQQARNAAISKMLGTKSDFDSRFLRRMQEAEEGTYGTAKLAYADPDKIDGYLNRITDPRRSVDHNQTMRHLKAREEALAVSLQSGELAEELVADFQRALEGTRSVRQTMEEAAERIGNANLVDEIIKQEGASLVGANAAIAGGLIGGPIGAVAGSALTALAKPGSIARQIAVVESMAQRAGMVDKKIDTAIARHFATLKPAARKARAVAGAVTRGVRTAGRAARVAAIPVMVQMYGRSARERREKVEKDIARVEAYTRDPIASVRRASGLTRGMSDSAPGVTAALAGQHMRVLDFLAGKIPPRPSILPLQPKAARPRIADHDIVRTARYFAAAKNPLGILQDLEAGSVTPEAVETMKAVWPKLYQEIRMRVMKRITDSPEQLPFDATIQLSLMLDIPGHPMLTPGFLQRQQERWLTRTTPEQPAAPTGAVPNPAANALTLSEKVTANLS